MMNIKETESFSLTDARKIFASFAFRKKRPTWIRGNAAAAGFGDDSDR